MLHLVEVVLDAVSINATVLHDFAAEHSGIGSQKIDKLLVNGLLSFGDKLGQQWLPLCRIAAHSHNLATDLREVL